MCVYVCVSVSVSIDGYRTIFRQAYCKFHTKCMCMHVLHCLLTWVQEYDGHGIVEDLRVLLSENTSGGEEDHQCLTRYQQLHNVHVLELGSLGLNNL